MRSIFRGIFRIGAAGVLLSLGGLGCQNKMLEENQGLKAQNLELQQKLDESGRQRAALAALPAPSPAVQVSYPTPKVEPTVTPEPPVVAAPPRPAPTPDLGGIQVTHDVAAGTTTMHLPSDVFFGSGQALLLPEAKKSLAKVIAALKKDYAAKPIRIEGHTDSDPIHKSKWKSNQELSEKRAEAVRDYLVSKGVPANRITTEGLGDTKPKSKAVKKENRRVELVVLTGK